MCGQKKIFRHWVTMADECPRCRFHFQRDPGEWLGSWFLNICLAQLLVVIVVAGGAAIFYPTPPILWLAGLGLFFTVGFPVIFFPYSRTIWLAIDLAMRPLAFDENVDPFWELEEDQQALVAERGGAHPTK